MDYLYLGDSISGAKYCPVLKDAFGDFCELIAPDTASARVAADAIISWYKRFNLPISLMTDNGTHFRNQVIDTVTAKLGMTHKLSPVYAPWLNGAVERVKRDVLQVARAMLLEAQLDVHNWDIILPVIQSCVNHSPVESLGNKCPMEIFTGLPPPPLLAFFIAPDGDGTTAVMVNTDSVARHLTQLTTRLQQMHKVVESSKVTVSKLLAMHHPALLPTSK